MGKMTARALRAMLSEQAAMEVHLRGNHYPPLPYSLVPVALRAVKYAKRGEWDHMIRLPHDVGYMRAGRRMHMAPVSKCVEAWHLDAFLE